MHLAQNRDIVNYAINSIEDLNKLIIHLEKYPLYTQKAADFFLYQFFLYSRIIEIFPPDMDYIYFEEKWANKR